MSTSTEGLEASKLASADARFAAYASFHQNLDTLIWQIPGFLAAVTAAVTALLAQDIGNLLDNRRWMVSVVLFLLSSFYLLGAFVMWRMRRNQWYIERVLEKLEPTGSGYFMQRRNRGIPYFLSAQRLFITLLVILGLAAAAAGIVLAGTVP